MHRTSKFKTKYGIFAAIVLSRIAACGAAGRSHDPARIEQARARHKDTMAFVRRQFGLA